MRPACNHIGHKRSHSLEHVVNVSYVFSSFSKIKVIEFDQLLMYFKKGAMFFMDLAKPNLIWWFRHEPIFAITLQVTC